MLTLDVKPMKYTVEDESGELFIKVTSGGTLNLEHSLISVSKWESQYHRSFFLRPPKENSELLDYIRCMTINKQTDDSIYSALTRSDLSKINDYIQDPMTATFLRPIPGQGGNGDVITSEVIYYQMIALGIPFECQKWHINRLITLIRLVGVKTSPPKNINMAAMAAQNRELNAQRIKQNSKH